MASPSRATPSPPAADVDAGRAPDNLTSVVLGGVLWKATTRGVAEVTRVVVVVVLARLLTPADYGVAGMALVVMSFGLMFTDPALGAALVQRPTIDERDRSTIFWSAATLGLSLTVLAVALSGIVARFFGEPEVRSLFAVSSIGFTLIGLSVAHRALLTRKLAYRSLELREMASIVTGGAVAVAVAAAGFGPWAIVSNFVAYSLVSTVLAWALLDWRPKLVYSRRSARNLGGFSAKVFGATLLTWGNQNLDKVFVGRALGAAPLGSYSLAYNTMQVPVGLVSGTVHQALSPAYSRIQRDRERLERVFLRSRRVSVALVVPALTALLVVAPDAVEIVFGSKWDAAIVPLQVLCLGGIASSLSALNWSILQASGEAGMLLRLTLLTSAVTWTAFAIGLWWGIVGVAASYAAARWLLIIPTTWITTRAVGFGFWATLRAGAVILPLAFVAGVVAYAARELLLLTDLRGLLRVGVVLAVMGSAYLVLLLLLVPSLLREVREVVRSKRGHSPSDPGPPSGTDAPSPAR